MTRSRRILAAVSVWLLAFSELGCADVLLRLGVTGCDPLMVSTEALPEEIDLHARFRMQIAGREAAFDAVVQRRGGSLSLVGLVPVGPRLFAVRQRGMVLDFVETPPGSGRAIAVRALDALHRAVWGADADSAPTGRGATDPSIDYRRGARADELSGFEIRNPDCRYETSIVLLDRALP